MTRSAVMVWASLALWASAGAVEVDLPRYPSLSPDGATLVFSWRGDLWRASSRGGRAERLTRDAASDARSAWSPDGAQIAFDSERSGALNLWVMQADGSGLRQVTHSDVGVALAGWDPAGTHLLASAAIEGDVFRGGRPYRVALAGGPLTRAIDAFGVSPQLSPDGRWLAFVRGGSRWTRRHYKGPDAREVWLYDTQARSFRQLTTYPGNDGLPRWVDAHTLAFLSDRDGVANVWVRDLNAGEARPATRFTAADVTAFDVARDGSWAVAVCWDALYGWDPRDPNAAPTRLVLSAPEDGAPRLKRVEAGGKVSEAALHPCGGVAALVAYGRVFVRGLGEHDAALTVSPGPDRAAGVRWSPDGTWLYFVSDRDGSDSIYRARVTQARRDVLEAYSRAAPAATPLELDGAEPASEGAEPAPPTGEELAERWRTALTVEVEGLVLGPQNDRDPAPDPTGRWLAFRRGRGDLVLLDLGAPAGDPGRERVLLQSWDTSLGWAWSPDGRHLAYSTQDRAFNADVFVVPVDGSAPAVNVSMHPNDDVRPCWSPDGKSLAFLSARDGDEVDVWRVHLDRRLDGLTPAEAAAYRERLQGLALTPPSVAEVASAQVAAPDTQARALDLDDAYLRLEQVTHWRGDEGDLALVPTGLVVSEGAVDGSRTLYHVDPQGERTELARGASLSSLSWDQKTLLVVQGGRAAQVPTAGGKLERIGFAADLDVDQRAEASQKFREAARVLGEVFYHPTLKGLDWAALTERYHALAARTQTAAEFREVANRFIGELNASHLGISPPSERPETFQPNGRLGVDVREEPGGALITRVLPQGPAATAPTPLRVGDRIVSILGQAWAPTDTLEARLRGRVGQETLLEVERPADAGPDAAPLRLGVLLTPVDYGSERTLRYQAWTAARRDRVHALSGGRIGYLHIRGMNYPSLMEFERDLFAATYGRDGLLVDVRNNGGGWTADRVLGALMARPHAYTVPRGADPAYTRGYPQGRLYIQRYTDPVNMLCNEKSFSNAEILSHAFRTYERGTLVGEQTYGGVISTGGMTLLDGTWVRLPFRGWYLLDGTDMENNGAVPHLRVPQTPEDEVAGVDRQLQVAVEDLLERLDAPK